MYSCSLLIFQAGIRTSKLTVALEPEVASLFCKNLSVEKNVGATGLSIDTFSPGSQYIVLDTGGMIFIFNLLYWMF